MRTLRRQLSAGKAWLARVWQLGILARAIPDRVLHKTAELSTDDHGQLGVSDFRVLEPSRTVELSNPDDCRFLQRQVSVPYQGCRFLTEEVFICSLRDCRLDPVSGAVVASDGSLLVDSIKNRGRLRHVSSFGGLLPATRTESGVYSTIQSPYTGNYFHWLLESLPRLHSLALWGEPITLLMSETLGEFQRAMLAMCLPENLTLRYVGEEWLQVEQFVLPSFLTRQWDFAYLPYDHLRATRNRILAAHGLTLDQGGSRRLYISRAKARVRQVVNEDEVVRLLRQQGFEVVYLEELAFADQVRLLHDAAIVVAPHGAGLANLLFAGRIPVVEFVTQVATPVYFFLALALGQRYHSLDSLAATSGASAITIDDGRRYSATRDRDLEVPLNKLAELLERTL